MKDLSDEYEYYDGGYIKKTEFSHISESEFVAIAKNFMGEVVSNATQEEVEQRLQVFIKEMVERDIDVFRCFAFALPGSATREEIQSGNSAAAKVYRALFSFSRKSEYKQNAEIQMACRELENIIDQEPQMMGPVAMWQIAKDVMWRKDVPSHAKGSLMGSMTYALAFFDQESYKDELLKQLDFRNIKNYSEVAHMLEAMKAFWSSGYESYAEDSGVPEFYIDALSGLKSDSESNYLLSIRAKQILSVLEESNMFPNEARDKSLFEVTEGVYASTQNTEGVTFVPKEKKEEATELILSYEEIQSELMPPQYLVDEAVEQGLDYVTWSPPSYLWNDNDKAFAEMHSVATLNLEDLLPHIKQMSDEERDELVFDYEYLISRPMREMIQREFGFELKDFTISEQFYFLNYLKTVTVGDAENVKYFTAKFGATGFKTFLSLRHGREIGDEIVFLGNYLEQEDAQVVFEKYSEIVDTANKVDDFILENVEGGVDIKTVEQVKENILKRGKDLLATFADKARKFSEKEIPMTTGDILEKLELVKSDAILFTSTFKTLRAEGMSLEDYKNINFESMSATQVSPQDVQKMISIFELNYATANPEFKKTVIKSFADRLKNEDVNFYIVKDKGEIISFLSIQPNKTESEVDRPSVYFGSFNTDPNYQGAAIGDAVMKRVLDSEAKENIIHATCTSTLPISSKYIEDGFVGTKHFEIEGEMILEIVRDDTLNLKSKGKTKEEIVELYLKSKLEGVESSSDIEIFAADKQEDFDFSFIKDKKVVTRYFKFSNKWYVVVENL